MSFQAQDWARRQHVGNLAAKAILGALANYADEDGSCFPSQERIARDCECSVRTVQRWLDYLETGGLIERERRHNGRGERSSDRFLLRLHDNLSRDSLSSPTRQSVAPSKEEPFTEPVRLSLPARDRGPREELLEVLDEAHADAVIEHRKQLGSPLDAYKAKLLASKLNQWPSPNAAADEMINSGWKTFKSDWMKKPSDRAAASSSAGDGKNAANPVADRVASGEDEVVSREREPALFARCIALMGATWSHKAEWKAAAFPAWAVDRARQRMAAA